MPTLADIYQALMSYSPSGAGEVKLEGVVVDSRLVGPGALFIALKGEKADGNDYVGDAIKRGAVAVITDKRGSVSAEREDEGSGPGPSVHVVEMGTGAAGLQPDPEPLVPVLFLVPSTLKALQDVAAFWRAKFPKCKVVGVTGSVGKSSTKELISSVLSRRYATLKSRGNYNNEIGLPLSLFQMNDSIERAVLEMGTYAIGEIRELCRIAQPTIGVVTNVGPSHLERLGTIERISQAKGELPENLPAEGVAILNNDDPFVRSMRDKTPARVFTYGLDPTSDLWADEIESHGLEGIAFDLHIGSERMHVRVPLLGRHSVHTALAAASVGLADGLSWDEILSGLTDAAAQLRLLAVPAEKDTTILDDTYNASPESSLAALNLLAELNGRKVAVLGDMLELGSFEERGHRIVGGRAAQVVSALIAVGEKGRWIGESALDAGLKNTHFAKDNAQAIEILREVMSTGDLILIKGSRGARMEEIVNAVARPTESVK